MLHYVLLEGHIQIHAVELALHVTALSMGHAAPDAVRVFHLYRVPKTLTTDRTLGVVLSSPPADRLRLVGDVLVQATVAWWIEDVGVDVLALGVVAPRMWWIDLHNASARKEWEYEFGFFWRGYRATDRSLAVCTFCMQLALQTYLCKPVVFFHDDVVATSDVQRE